MRHGSEQVLCQLTPEAFPKRQGSRDLVRCCLVAHCSDFWVFYFHNNVLQLLTLSDDWTLKSVYIHLLVQNNFILECLLEYLIYILLTHASVCHVLLYNR